MPAYGKFDRLGSGRSTRRQHRQQRPDRTHPLHQAIQGGGASMPSSPVRSAPRPSPGGGVNPPILCALCVLSGGDPVPKSGNSPLRALRALRTQRFLRKGDSRLVGARVADSIAETLNGSLQNSRKHPRMHPSARRGPLRAEPPAERRRPWMPRTRDQRPETRTKNQEPRTQCPVPSAINRPTK